jgi:hypothetical protein
MGALREMFPQSAPKTTAAKDMMLTEWDLILLEVGSLQFDQALSAHIRSSEWFPTVAKIREHACMKRADEDAVEAGSAWDFCVKFETRYWHPDLGTYRNAPAIPPRTAYALRQVGGLPSINNCKLDNLPFMQKNFIEAYRLAPMHERMQPQLEAVFGGSLAELVEAKSMALPPRKEPVTDEDIAALKPFPSYKPVEDIDARRRELQAQAQRLLQQQEKANG